MIIFIHWSDKKPVANKRKKRKENCLSVSNFAQKRLNGFASNFQERLAMGH